jgi:hypothetical protein
MAEDIKSLKKLSPQERIKKLKELQEKSKKEIEEAQKMISESEEEAVHEETLRRIPIPQLKAVSIDELFSREEKELFKSYKFFDKTLKPAVEDELETKIKKEKIKLSEEEKERIVREEQERVVQYGRTLSKKPAEALYGMAKQIRDEVEQTGYINKVQEERLAAIEYAENKKMRDIHAGKYVPDSEAADMMIMTQRVKNQLMEKYESGNIYRRAA